MHFKSIDGVQMQNDGLNIEQEGPILTVTATENLTCIYCT